MIFEGIFVINVNLYLLDLFDVVWCGVLVVLCLWEWFDVLFDGLLCVVIDFCEVGWIVMWYLFEFGYEIIGVIVGGVVSGV